MNNILLSLMFAAVEGAANVPEDFLGKLGYGLQIALIGIGIVFVVLALIMGVLYLFEYFFYTLPNKMKKAPKEPKTPAVSTAPAVTLPAVSADNDDEIAVVIAAAVAAYYDQAAPTSRYRIKSFRRI